MKTCQPNMEKLKIFMKTQMVSILIIYMNTKVQKPIQTVVVYQHDNYKTTIIKDLA